MAREDIRILIAAWPLLTSKGYCYEVKLALMFFLHILYFKEGVALGLALVFIAYCFRPFHDSEMATKPVVEALRYIWMQVDKQCAGLHYLDAQLVSENTRTQTSIESGRKLHQPNKNPCNWNRESSKD